MQPNQDTKRPMALMGWAATSYIIVSVVYFGSLLVYLNVFAGPSYVFPPGFAVLWTANSVFMIVFGVFALALFAFLYRRLRSFPRVVGRHPGSQ
jgi:hypothetical protein